MSRPTLELARRLDDSQWWAQERHRNRQLCGLNKILASAASDCPYYAARRLQFRELNYLEELSELPLLSRESLRIHCDEMRSNKHFQPLVGHTHGTADEPVRFYWDRMRQAWDKAHRLRGQSWHGFDIGDRELHFWPVDPATSLRGRLQQGLRSIRDRLTGELQLDMMGLSDCGTDRIDAWWRGWRRFVPLRVSAFPSALAELILRGCAGSSESGEALQGVCLTGEVAFDWQRKLIEEALGAPIMQCYGLQEVGPIAFECEQGSWHTCAESVFVEIIRSGRPAKIGELGEAVVTGLQSEVMPMIRYCTGDIVRAEAARDCPCGRELPLMPTVLGRAGDFLENRDGQWISPEVTISRISRCVAAGRFRVLQDSCGDVAVQLSGVPEIKRLKVEAAVQELLGSTVRCHIQHVSSLQRTRFAKCRYVQSARTSLGLAAGSRGESSALSI